MPEGPEIRRAADRVAAIVEGREAREVFFAFAHLESAAEALRGRRITRVMTHGKAMLTHFDDRLVVYSHNQLYGRWMVRKKDGLPRTNRQLRFAIHTDEGGAFLYSASEIEVLEIDDLWEHPYLSRLGPDPLHPDTNARVLRAQISRPSFARRRLSGLLLDQSFIAGLGNYLRSEILFAAGLDPRARPIDLDPAGLGALARATGLIVKRAYRTGGITTDAARVRAMKKAGLSRRAYRHFVFARRGHPCRVCDTRIVEESLDGRRLYRCPACQPAFRADRR